MEQEGEVEEEKAAKYFKTSLAAGENATAQYYLMLWRGRDELEFFVHIIWAFRANSRPQALFICPNQ